MTALPSNCLDCPMARHLDRDRFFCGNSLTKVVRGHHRSTAECHDAVRHSPHLYFQPLLLPDLQGLDPEWVCDRIHLNLNWLDVYDDAPRAKDGEIEIEVCHYDLRIGYLRRSADLYYCERLVGMRPAKAALTLSLDPYWLALHLIHPDYLHQISLEIVAARAIAPDYF